MWDAGSAASELQIRERRSLVMVLIPKSLENVLKRGYTGEQHMTQLICRQWWRGWAHGNFESRRGARRKVKKTHSISGLGRGSRKGVKGKIQRRSRSIQSIR